MQNIMEKCISLFVVCGTQKFPFSRLTRALNGLVEQGLCQPEAIVMQSQANHVMPLFETHALLSVAEFGRRLAEAEVVVTHAGVNSIITCMQMRKPLLIVPRQKVYGEHVDNHQVEIARLMEEKFGVTVDYDLTHLQQSIEAAREKRYAPWVSDKAGLLDAIRRDIDSFL